MMKWGWMMNRMSIENYYMNIANVVSLRSTCMRRKVGAVIVKDNRILSTGYNGSPSGFPNCNENEGKCYRCINNIPSGEQLDKCYAVHAEQNAIMSGMRTGENLKGATIYITTFPCITCAKLIVQSGINKIYYIDKYRDEFTLKMLKTVGVEVINLENFIK